MGSAGATTTQATEELNGPAAEASKTITFLFEVNRPASGA